MAKENMANPFLDDDDEVDDYTFLTHPKQGKSGYIFANSNEVKEGNEWEIKRMQLLENKRQIEERTLQSTNDSLGLMYESEQVGCLTAEELIKQREQLQNIDQNLDTISNTMRTSQKHINSIKSIFGSFKNYFSKGSTSDPAVMQPSKTVSSRNQSSYLNDIVGDLKTDTKLSEATHPGLKIREISYEDETSDMQKRKVKVLSPTTSSRFSNDIDGKIDQNLDHLSMGLGRLKNLAIGLNEEIEQQNDMIDTIHNKADKADETLEYQNRQIKRILKK